MLFLGRSDRRGAERLLGPAALGAVSSAALAAAWGLVVEPRLVDVREEVGELPGLPTPWHGRRVALFSDMQVGWHFDNADTTARIVRRVVEERPALVLIAGDFVYRAARNRGSTIPRAAGLVRPLSDAGLLTYAVLGNHDYAEESTSARSEQRAVAEELRAALEAVGVRVLRNEAVALPTPGGEPDGGPPLFLVGIDDYRVGQDRPLAAVGQVPTGAARLVLMHHPASFRILPAGSAPLALAGHTHGGQIRVPFFPKLTPSRLRKRWPRYRDGWIEGYGEPGNRLYANRGIGFSTLPIRFGCPPELTLFTLRRAPA